MALSHRKQREVKNKGGPQSALSRYAALMPWHFLYFLPEPQGQGSLRPTLACWRLTGAAASFGPVYITCSFGRGGGRARETRCDSSRSDSRPPPASSIFQSTLTTRSWMRSIIDWNISNDSRLYSMSGSRWP